MTSFFLLVLCALTFTCADYFAARWGHRGDLRSLSVVLLIGPLAYLLFGYLAKATSLAKMGGYVNSGIVLFTTAAGIAFLNERPDRTTWMGIGLIVVGLALLAQGQVHTRT